MTTRILRALLATLALVSASISVAALLASPAQAAEYCTYTEPATVYGHPVGPSGEYCIPGP
ncbi:MAG: hypothetical protein QOI82_74 [Actinomycetota bacterium]|jgi:hypothetical protein|nr:hypothetical protein [Actinomycetota bacterium]